ncbi:MAG: hypothetical protein AAF737_05925 [Pseudomonadota bacterium]
MTDHMLRVVEAFGEGVDTTLGRKRVFAGLVDWSERGASKPLWAEAFQLENMAAAHKASQDKKHMGRIATQVAQQ